MTVAWSDGHLHKKEVKLIRQVLTDILSVSSQEIIILKETMKAKSQISLEDCIKSLKTRLPHVETEAVLKILADIAHADDKIHPFEVEMIHRVSALMGVDEFQWSRILEDLNLGAPFRLEEYFELLGISISSGATASDIKQAYRRKVRDYHPDHYQNLPEEFKKLAKEMTIKLNEARDELLRYCV